MKFLKFFLVLLVVTSCKSKKALTDGELAFEKLSAKKVAKKHVASNFNKQTIDAKLKVKYNDTKEKVGLSVRMKIKKDEVIYLKGNKIVTVFKAKITPTKVSYYSPHFKDYFEGDFSMISKLLGTDVNFEQLQNMLLGQSLLSVTSKKQRVEIEEQSYKLSPKNQANLFDVFFFINPKHFKLNKQSLISNFKNQRLDISYPEYLEKDNVVFPKKININAKKDTKFTTIDLDVRSVVFNTTLTIPFSIPLGYKKIKL